MTKSSYLTRIFEEASSSSRSNSVSPTKNNTQYLPNNNNISSDNHNTRYDNTIVKPVPIKFDNSYNQTLPIRYICFIQIKNLI